MQRSCPHSVEVPGYGQRRLTSVLVDSGVSTGDVDAMTCPDVHAMVALIARANFVARADRRLLLDEPSRPPHPNRRVRVVRALDALTALMFLIIVFTAWRFLND